MAKRSDRSPGAVAVLTIHGLDTMSEAYRKLLASWLRGKAKDISSKKANDKFSKRFVARHY